MNNAIRKGIIYCRVSSHEQVQGTSLDNQKRACLEYAERQGIKVVRVFIEKGESATAADRTEFLKALDHCRDCKPNIEAFIVWKVDRFARNTTDHFAVRAKLIQYGSTLHSVTEPISADPQGKLMETMLAGFAEFENGIRKQRCNAGRQARLREGIYPCKPPLGYLHSKRVTDRRKTRPDDPDPERFHIIQRGLKEYLKGGITIATLTDKFNQWGLRTKANKPLSKQRVEELLRKKFYAGILIDPWTGEEYVGQHQPMITLEEYERIQYVKKHGSRLQGIPHLSIRDDFPLKRFVKCVCGYNLSASWRKGRNQRYPYYHCRNVRCEHNHKGIPKEELESKFIERLREIEPKQQRLKLFEKIIVDLWKSQYETLQQQHKTYEARLRSIEGRNERLLEMRVNGEISTEQFAIMKDRIDNEAATIQISKNEIKIEEHDIEATVSYAMQFAGNIVRIWQDNTNAANRMKIQKMVFPQGITYNKVTREWYTTEIARIFEIKTTPAVADAVLVAGAGVAPAISWL